MSYSYEKERSWVFTDEGQRQFLRIRDHAAKLFAASGCATLGKLIDDETGDSFRMLACVDRLVEIGEIVMLYKGPSSQQSVFGPTR